MMKYIAAHTAHNNDYPGFVNVSHNEKNNKVKITVREQGHPEKCGEIVELEMTLDDYASFVIEQAEFMARYVPKDPNQKKLDV